MRSLSAASVVVVVLCAASCKPGEPKRLPPARATDRSDAPAATFPSDAPAETAATVLSATPVVTVTHPDGSPYESCKVSAFEPSSHARVAGGTTDKDGVARLADLDTARRYELLVEPPINDADAFEASRTHSWPPSDTAVKLGALLTVEGHVNTADGSPAKGAAVRCSHAKGAVSVSVGANGRFAFKRVPEGPVELAVAPSFTDAERGRCGPPTQAKAGDRDVVLTAR